VARIMMLEPELADPDSPAAKQVKKYLDLDPNWHMTPSLVVQGGTSRAGNTMRGSVAESSRSSNFFLPLQVNHC
jgi:hypothetical protein